MKTSRILAACAAIGLLVAACGNAGSSKPVSTPTTRPGAAPITEVSGAQLQKNIPLTGVQGVTNSQIDVAVITAGTNPLAGDYSTFVSGIQAYFNMVNAAGGVYGRRLVISQQHDDQFVNDEHTVKASLAAGSCLRDVRRDAALRRRARHCSQQSADAHVHLEHQPGIRGEAQPLRERGRALLHLRQPDRAVHRPGGTPHENRRTGLWLDRHVEGLRGRREGELREIPVGQDRVLRPRPAGRAAQPHRRGLEDEGEQGSARVHERRPAGDAHPGQGDRQATPRRGAVREQPLQPAVRPRQRPIPRGRRSWHRSSPRSRTRR